ncbi:MAG: sugar ABC transporter permease [Clostridia bacterium]|nr:sugar ABC transporter permease [Clostridia bacterium]
MSQLSDLEYLKLSKGQKFGYRLGRFFTGIPKAIGHFFQKIGKGLGKGFAAVGREIADIVNTFIHGDWKTKLSFFVMGFGNIARGQVLRGLLFLLFEIVFIAYMILSGGYWLSMLPSLGLVGPTEEYNEILDAYTTTYHDNSFQILLYGVLTIFFIIAFIYTWRVNIRQNKIAEKILASGKKLKSGKDDLRSIVDDQFHKTLLALPVTGIFIFTVLPILFMILVAFTNYDGTHNGYTNSLFTWVGLDNFNTMLSWAGGSGGTQSYAATFGEVLLWTLIWAFFATFTNYFLGMFVAMAINKKGIKFKKGWRTILVLTIAIPQFISLLYVSKMFAKNGIINGFLLDMGWIDQAIDFFGDASRPWLARVTVILINIWIGIPYLMLITTGILMNIPADLYESAKIDGASGWQQYRKITLPYMLFVTGPYLLTSFTGNMNNFNVIYLLTAGAPTNAAASSAAGSVGYTDLLITWLFKITTGAESKYYLASVIGILVFVVVALISLIVYNLLPSIKNEEDFR